MSRVKVVAKCLRFKVKKKNYDLKIIGINAMGNPFVRYQDFPAQMGRHHVTGIDYFVYVNPAEPALKIPSELFHCVDCKLMGSIQTFRGYRCT